MSITLANSYIFISPENSILNICYLINSPQIFTKIFPSNLYELTKPSVSIGDYDTKSLIVVTSGV